MYSKLLPIFSLAACAAALDFTNWSPAGPGDVRSPCPALNSLANHNILPHDGKGLTVPMLRDALEQAYHLAPDLSTFLAVGGLFASPNPLGGTVDLNDLDKHDFLEHDASLSRQDYHLGGDDHTFRQDIFDQVLAFWGDNEYTTIESAAKAKYQRLLTELAADPQIVYGPIQYSISWGENAIYLMVMGDQHTGIAPVEYIKIFFEQERLPYNEGWRTPAEEITFDSAKKIVSALQSASGEAIPEGLIITNNTLAQAFLGLNVLVDSIPTVVQDVLNEFGLGGVF